jgi:hypothetical protein
MSARDLCIGHWKHRQFNINTVLSYTLELDQGILRQNIAESAKGGLLTRPPAPPRMRVRQISAIF